MQDENGNKRKPTLDELWTYYQVRDHFRWHTEQFADLSSDEDLFKKTETLLTIGGDQGLNTWNLYVAGYYTAARSLIVGPPDEFFLLFGIYPVLFLYRHYVELEIKGIIIAVGEILSIPLPDFGNDHNILSLWNKFKSMLPAEHPALRSAPSIEKILTQIHALDPKSMDTRYGLRRDLQGPSLEQPFEIDVDNLRETMERLHNELSVMDEIVKTCDEEDEEDD